MRYYMRFVAFVDGLVATVVSLAMILGAYPDPWSFWASARGAVSELLGSSQPYLALGGTVLLILNAVAFTRRLFGLNRSKDLPLSEGAQNVRIRTAAVEDLLARICEANAIVAAAKVRVFSRLGGKYRIVCSLSLVDAPEFHKVVDRIRARLKERFLEVLPQALQVAVDVLVTEIRRQDRAVPSEEGVYSGPQYPVGDEYLQAPPQPVKKK